MRLRDTMYLLGEVLPQLKIILTTPHAKTYNVQNFQNFRFAVQRLVDAELFKSFTTPIIGHSFWSQANDSFIVPEAEFNTMVKAANNLINAAFPYYKSLEMVIPAGTADMVCVKIPNPQNFDELVDIARTLQVVFERPLQTSSFSSSVNISNFDSGSFWIDFVVGNPDAMLLVAELCHAAVYLYKCRLEQNRLKDNIRSLDMKQDALDATIAAIDKRIEDVAEIETENLHVKFFKKDSDDLAPISDIKTAIRSLSDLYEKGAEVRPSIEVKVEIKAIFPDVKKIDSVESRVKKIENKTTKENPKKK